MTVAFEKKKQKPVHNTKATLPSHRAISNVTNLTICLMCCLKERRAPLQVFIYSARCEKGARGSSEGLVWCLMGACLSILQLLVATWINDKRVWLWHIWVPSPPSRSSWDRRDFSSATPTICSQLLAFQEGCSNNQVTLWCFQRNSHNHQYNTRTFTQRDHTTPVW